MQMGDLSSTTPRLHGHVEVCWPCLFVLVCRALRSGSDKSCGSYGKWAMRDEEAHKIAERLDSRYCQSCKRRELSVSSYLDEKNRDFAAVGYATWKKKTYQHLWLVDVLLARRHR